MTYWAVSVLGDIMIRKLLTATAVAALTTSATFAQDYSLNPTYGVISLNSGFLRDAGRIEITAGGPMDASTVGCLGSIADAPDVRLMWGGGEMTIGSESNVDTTLLVNGPDGEWYCSDDVYGLNPALDFSEAGQYDIWIGVFNHSSMTARALFYVYEE